MQSHARPVAILTVSIAALAALSGTAGRAQTPVTITVDASKPGPRIDPMFYGLMTEEINFSYDGGLYAELIRNRAFKDDAKEPAHWSVVKDGGADGAIALADNAVPNTALTAALKLEATSVPAKGRVGAANEGYWGIPVKPDTTYRASFWASADNGFDGSLTLSIETNDGVRTWAAGDSPRIVNGWKKYAVTLKTTKATPSTTNRFVVSAHSKGTVWLSLVSLFPPTYKNRPNGNRVDIMELLAAMHPKFLRFPGGNYLEGPDYENRFNWKATIGPLEDRPTHMSPWRYRSSDGMGLLEFLEWTEDLAMEPVLAVYAGLHIDRGANIVTGDALKPHVQDALDEIEYATGGTNTTWGSRRAKDGHPKPFPLHYVEIGNEDWLNNGTASYDSRFTMFYDAIKAKYPSLKIISTFRTRDTTFVHSRPPDLLDDHFYVTIPTALSQAHLYDSYSRSRDESVRRRMGDEQSDDRHAHGRHPDAGVRVRRCRVAHRPRAQRRPRHHELLRAAVRERESGRTAVGGEPDRLRRAHELRVAVVLRAEDVLDQPRRYRAASDDRSAAEAVARRDPEDAAWAASGAAAEHTHARTPSWADGTAGPLRRRLRQRDARRGERRRDPEDRQRSGDGAAGADRPEGRACREAAGGGRGDRRRSDRHQHGRRTGENHAKNGADR